MPCGDPGHSVVYRDSDHASEAVRLLCATLTHWEINGIPIPDEFQSWWNKHKEHDESYKLDALLRRRASEPPMSKAERKAKKKREREPDDAK